jgi:AcrR family transcriptional regulator
MDTDKKNKTKIQVKSPTQERSKQTVAAILEACAQLIAKEGYYSVTTDRIAETAGVSIGSLYQFFGNKESVVSALIKQMVEEDRHYFFEKMQLVANLSNNEKIMRMLEIGFEIYRIKPELRTALQTVRLYLTEPDYLTQSRRILMDVLRAHLPTLTPGRDPDKVAFITVTAYLSIMNNSLLDSPSLVNDPELMKELFLMFKKYLEIL